MSSRFPQSSVSKKARAQAADKKLLKQLRVVLVLALLGGGVVGGLAGWDRWFASSPEQLIKIYWTHDCSCVFEWISELKAEGFEVHSYEYDTLQYERASLHMPANLHGCHVGTYFGYFVEGHVAPSALRQLARERPKGYGVVTQAVLTAEAGHIGSYLDENSPVLLIQENGQARRWFTPRD